MLHNSHYNPIHIDHQELLRRLDYDPETGVFVWHHRAECVRAWNKRTAGTVAGSIQNGHAGVRYLKIGLDGVIYHAHRLAWFHFYGEQPDTDLQIDHINGDGLDNRIVNLRLVEQSTNRHNKRVLPRNNRSGKRGVFWHNQTQLWRADITVRGKRLYLGGFANKQDAIKARDAAEQKYLRGKNDDRINSTTT